MTRTAHHCVVVGVGNPERGDDAAGRTVARRLRGVLPARVEIIEDSGEATALLVRLNASESVFLIDACASGAAAGTIRRFDAHEGPLPQQACGVSTHGFGVAAALELARTLGELPRRCIVYSIEGASFAAGAPLSPPVARAVAEVAERLRAEITGLAEVGEV